MSSLVPKFGSFKPRPQAPGKQDEKYTNYVEREGDEFTKHDQKHHEKRIEERHRRREHSQMRGVDFEHSEPQRQYSTLDSSNDLYVLDLAGDPDAPTYGKNKASSVPLHRTPLTFRVLGQSSGDNFHGSSGRSLLSSLTKDERKRLAADGRYYGPQLTNNTHAGEHDNVKDSDFLYLNSGKKRKRRSPSTQPLGAPQAFGVENQLVSDPEASDTSSSHSALDEQQEQKSSSLKEENAHLSNRIKTDPGNAQAWLDFINFQDEWLRHGQSTVNDEFSIEDRRSIAEVKVSMYEKALKAVPKDAEYRERLLLGVMEEAGKIYESHKLAEKWKEVANSNKDCQHLWLEYLKFSQTTSARFQYDECKQVYQEMLKILREHCRNTPNRAQHFEKLQVEVLLLLTCMMRDSGYTELATALWQSLLEANLFRPASLVDAQENETLLANFEEFWDSECARIGEQGATGWCNTSRQETSPQGSSSGLLEKDDSNRFRNWAAEEMSRSYRQLWPARTVDGEEDDDPFRVVLFSDLRPFLILLKTDEVKTQLVNAYLSFWNLPQIRDSTVPSDLDRLQCDPMIMSDSRASSHDQDMFRTELRRLSPSLFTQYQATTEMLFISDNAFSTIPNEVCVRHIVNVLDLLSSSSHGKTDLAEYLLALLAHTDAQKARKKAKSLLKTQPSSLRLYNTYALIEEMLGNEETANRVFRTAIKMSSSFTAPARQDAILLQRNWVWSALGSKLSRETALQRLVTICGDLPDVFEEKQVTHLSEDQIRDADSILRQNLDRALASFAKDTEHTVWRLIPYRAELLTLMTYTTTEDLSETLKRYEHLISYISTVIHTTAPSYTTSIVEHLHQLRAILIAHHTRSDPNFSPAEIRTALNDSISLFPQNTIFLTLRLENESRFKFDDRVRSAVHEAVTSPHSPTTVNESAIQTQAYKIALELRRYYRNDPPAFTSPKPNETSQKENDEDPSLQLPPLTTPHAIRAVFERALSSTTKTDAAHDATIWRTYLVFELEQHAQALRSAPKKPHAPSHSSEAKAKTKTKERTTIKAAESQYSELAKQRERVRDVYLRGVRALPWHKGFALMGFLHLSDPHGEDGEAILTEAELMAVYEGLGERGLRLSGEAL